MDGCLGKCETEKEEEEGKKVPEFFLSKKMLYHRWKTQVPGFSLFTDFYFSDLNLETNLLKFRYWGKLGISVIFTELLLFYKKIKVFLFGKISVYLI